MQRNEYDSLWGEWIDLKDLVLNDDLDSKEASRFFKLSEQFAVMCESNGLDSTPLLVVADSADSLVGILYYRETTAPTARDEDHERRRDERLEESRNRIEAVDDDVHFLLYRCKLRLFGSYDLHEHMTRRSRPRRSRDRHPPEVREDLIRQMAAFKDQGMIVKTYKEVAENLRHPWGGSVNRNVFLMKDGRKGYPDLRAAAEDAIRRSSE